MIFLFSNEKFIKEIINKYDLSIKLIKEIDTILNRGNISTMKEWDFLMSYLNEYTEKTQKEGFNWNLNYSIETYARYLETFGKLNREVILYPKEDIYYLVSELEEKREKLVNQIKITNKY